MKEILCYFGISTFITLFCVMVFDFDSTLRNKMQFFCWCESIIVILFGVALCFMIMTGGLSI